MSERPSDSGGLSSGDPLGGGGAPEPPRHESGLPGSPPAPTARRRARLRLAAAPGADGPVAPVGSGAATCSRAGGRASARS